MNNIYTNPREKFHKFIPELVLHVGAMKNLLSLLLLIFIPLFLYSQPTLITKPNTGRLGDQMSTFSRALYFSYLYDLPLVASPFKHADLFYLHTLYPCNLPTSDSFDQVKTIKRTREINPDVHNTLYIVPYYIDNYIEGRKNNAVSTPNFNDPEYMELLKAALSPIDPIHIIHPPEGKISVAIHLRTGEEAGIQTRKAFPYKFIGKHSALRMLKSLLKELPQDSQLYVHVFSDVSAPKKYLNWFRKNSPKNIEWETTYENQTIESVLSDLFSMASFDYIIRPSSNFSLFSLVLGNHKRALIGTKSHWSDKNKEVVVDTFITTTRKQFFEEYFFN